MQRIAFTLLSCTLLCGAASLSLAADAVSVKVAVQKGLADVKILGLNGSSGDSIQIDVRRKVGREVRIDIQPGTVFKSAAGDVQNMAAVGVKWERIGEGSWRKVNVIVLSDNRPRTYIVESYCLDFDKPNPKQSSSFSLDVLDKRTTRVLVEARKTGATPKVVQTAVWIDQGNVKIDVLRKRFPVSDEEVEAARALLVSVRSDGQKTDVNVQLEQLLAEIRRRAAQRRTAGIKRGDTVTVAAGGAELRRLGRVVAKLPQGTKLSVLRVLGGKVNVTTTIDGKSNRGWVAAAGLALPRPQGDTPRLTPPTVELPETLRQFGLNLDVFGKR